LDLLQTGNVKGCEPRMNSIMSRFWPEYFISPEEIQRKAGKAFQLWRCNSRHPTFGNPHNPAIIASRMSVASTFTECRWRRNSAARQATDAF
jgi:hypothetical protein